MFDSSWDASLVEQLDAETEAISGITLTSDFQEGIKAFTEKLASVGVNALQTRDPR